MPHHLHSALISYNRRELTEQTLTSFLATVSIPYSLVIVDNGSSPENVEWLRTLGQPLLLLGQNHYPGYATNRGWEQMPPQTTLLHRIDNDTQFLPGWCDEMVEAFDADPRCGQYGLTGADDGPWAAMPTWPVGGNSIVCREVYTKGLRYSERPWSKEWASEDSQLTRDVWDLGYERVFGSRPGIIYLGGGDPEYYAETRSLRGLT